MVFLSVVLVLTLLFFLSLFSLATGPVRLHRRPADGHGGGPELGGERLGLHQQPGRAEQPGAVALLAARLAAPLQPAQRTLTLARGLPRGLQPVTLGAHLAGQRARYVLPKAWPRRTGNTSPDWAWPERDVSPV